MQRFCWSCRSGGLFAELLSCVLLHSIQDRAHDSSDYAAFYGFSAGFTWQVFINGVGELSNRKRLQPDPPRPGERDQEDSVATEDHVFHAGNGCDLKRHAGLKCSDMPGVDAQSFSRLQVADHEFARKFEPCCALSAEVLKQETAASENACAKRLLESD